MLLHYYRVAYLMPLNIYTQPFSFPQFGIRYKSICNLFYIIQNSNRTYLETKHSKRSMMQSIAKSMMQSR